MALEKFGSAVGLVLGWVYRTFLFVCAYLVISFLIFGDVYRPMLYGLSLGMDNGFPLPSWIGFSSIIIGVLAASSAAVFMGERQKSLPVKLPIAAVFIAILMGTAAFTADRLATVIRYKEIKALNADKVSVRSFRKSLRTDPKHWTYPHAVALKNCEPFIWSYRTMSFHPLDPRRSQSVLPQSWNDDCEKL